MLLLHQTLCPGRNKVNIKLHGTRIMKWGGVGHVNVHVHLRGMLMLWVVLTFIFTGVGWGGVGHVNVMCICRSLCTFVTLHSGRE